MSVSISLDLGQVPSVLLALASPGVAVRAAKVAAQRYNDDVHDWIDAGSAFTPRLGQLQQSINWQPLADGAVVYANATYAAFVEHGTGIPAGHQQWIIRPRERSALKISVSGGGGFMFRRSVIHKGSQAKPFFFADVDNRQGHMVEAARWVITQAIAGH
jgi:hypothetical protein